jgi:hypothetical protein
MTTSVVDLEVPETLQALVASRLDGLSGSERRRVTSLLPPAGAAASVALGTEAQRYFEHAMELSNDDLERAGLLEQAGQALWQSGTPPAPSSVCARQPSSTGAATLPWRAVRRCCSPQSCACRAISTRHAPCLGDSGQRRGPASTGSFAPRRWRSPVPRARCSISSVAGRTARRSARLGTFARSSARPAG